MSAAEGIEPCPLRVSGIPRIGDSGPSLGQRRVAPVDARVQVGDQNPRAVVAERPSLGSADLTQTVGDGIADAVAFARINGLD